MRFHTYEAWQRVKKRLRRFPQAKPRKRSWDSFPAQWRGLGPRPIGETVSEATSFLAHKKIKQEAFMHKRIKTFFCILLAAILLASVPVAAQQPIRVILDGRTLQFDVQPTIIDGRTMVPMRVIFEEFGATLAWNEQLRQVTATRGDLVVTATVGSYLITVNGNARTMDIAPVIIDGRTLVPLLFVSEAFGATVSWDGANRIANIITGAAADEYAAPAETGQAPPAAAPPASPVSGREAPFAYTRSAITIPNRRLTAAERQEWIDEYNANGGASAFELEIVRLVNVERASRGLSPLAICHTLMLTARFYAQTMADLDTGLGHRYGPYGGSFETADAFGDRMVGVRAANGTAGSWTPEAAITIWMNSPEHRANILDPDTTRMGTGFALGGEWGVYGYQIFGGGEATAVPAN